ncbi:MAG: tRNA pseudouridine(38-40) synthase TruA, partial [Proteobacteria bacterium]|nr:tRNA pseudouridine(38-40) synthase TruA [Pseudomonadota bacterium]
TANAFVKHMVRNIAGTLVDAGKGKMSPEELKNILARKDRTLAGITAPPQGLFLKKIYYKIIS